MGYSTIIAWRMTHGIRLLYVNVEKNKQTRSQILNVMTIFMY